jgi:hypothetical protein
MISAAVGSNKLLNTLSLRLVLSGPYLRPGPGPGQQISRGGILKKIEIEVWYAGKKAVHEREI